MVVVVNVADDGIVVVVAPVVDDVGDTIVDVVMIGVVVSVNEVVKVEDDVGGGSNGAVVVAFKSTVYSKLTAVADVGKCERSV